MLEPQDAWLRVKTILRGAWDLPADARSAYVTAAAGDDDRLRSEVLSFLDSMDLAETWFESPALGGDGGEAARRMLGSPGAGIGSVFSSWRVVRELGHGGMGTVYLAERVEREFMQHGALKVVRGFADAELLRRFRDERRILAELQHPYITRVLDGGATANGIPFVVMEYVEGKPISEYCSGRRLDLSARLELFRKVCAAVHYAHQRLVIHRDIKDNNILVTEDGTPKLLDFGIAKLLEADGGSAVTLLRAQTPESASPEQVLGNPVTIATDIYSLGVLLYRLLTHGSPYGDAVGSETALTRAIVDSAPKPPSAADRAASADGGLQVPRDLDLIVLKALHKEPERRYSSVEALSDDVARFLAARPVLAVPDSWRYRSGKFLRRHRALTIAAGIAFVAIVAGAGLAAYEARIAQGQQLRAERRFADVRRLVNSFMFEFHDAISDLPGALRARQLVVKRATEYLDDLARESQDDVALQRELATANERLATILGGGGVSNLGDLAGAKQRYMNALASRERLATRVNPSQEDLDALVDLRVQLARFFVVTGELDRAEQEAAAGVALLTSMPATAASWGRQATALHQLGYVQEYRGETAAASASFGRAVDYARRRATARSADTADLVRLARIEIDAGRSMEDAGRAAEALSILEDARQTLERLRALDPRNVRLGENLFEALSNQGDVLEMLGDRAAELHLYTEAAYLSEALLADSPDDRTVQIAVTIGHQNLGVGLLETGDITAAVTRLRTANAEADAIVRRAPDNGFVRHRLAMIKARLGEALLTINSRDPEGCRVLLDGLARWDQLAASGGIPDEPNRHRPEYVTLSARCGQMLGHTR